MKKTFLALLLAFSPALWAGTPALAHPTTASCMKLEKELALMVLTIRKPVGVKAWKVMLSLIEKGALTGKENTDALIDAQLR